MKCKPFITLHNISLRLQNKRILENTSWQINNNENWLILGPNGAGKSTLAKALLGEVPVVSGRIIYHFFENNSSFRSNINKVGYVSPELACRVFEKELFQEEVRHFTGRVDQKTTLADLVVDGQNTHLDAGGLHTKLAEIAKATNIEKLLDREINVLSTGEMSRALIARALMKEPKLLILDEPFDGLDKKSRDQLSATIDDLISRELRIILITQRFEEIVPGITHVLYVKDGRIHSSGVKKELLTRQRVNEVFGIKSPLFSRLNYCSSKAANHEAQNGTVHGPVLEMNKVKVKYGEVVPLSDFTWTVQQNENWIIFGPEGAGKTTILKLIVGENLQRYANDIHLFGKKRGGGQSIWEVRSAISG